MLPKQGRAAWPCCCSLYSPLSSGHEHCIHALEEDTHTLTHTRMHVHKKQNAYTHEITYTHTHTHTQTYTHTHTHTHTPIPTPPPLIHTWVILAEVMHGASQEGVPLRWWWWRWWWLLLSCYGNITHVYREASKTAVCIPIHTHTHTHTRYVPRGKRDNGVHSDPGPKHDQHHPPYQIS
jgi:hypothetical protein